VFSWEQEDTFSREESPLSVKGGVEGLDTEGVLSLQEERAPSTHSVHSIKDSVFLKSIIDLPDFLSVF
jgi:hypothetical protein